MKGVMPYVPKVLPAVIPDPAVRRRAEEAFLSEDFKENIETYFVDNIKVLYYNIILKWLDTSQNTCMEKWDRNYLKIFGILERNTSSVESSNYQEL